MDKQNIVDTDIAIIGMSARFPGAKNVHEYWQNLREGRECISFFSEAETRESLLQSLGYIPEDTLARWLNDPRYVKAGAGLEQIDLFDAEFFGYNAAEAEIMDPQQRIFLECAWEALEDAGYSTESSQCLVGVYAGSEDSSYHHNLHSYLIPAERDLLTVLGNERDYLTTRVSYKLNLTGPSMDIQCACSTSLVATHIACQSLRNGECDIALAGGVAAHPLQKVGYIYPEGGMVSPDGHCRPFDARAQGTVYAHGGVGIVVLKRLAEALEHGDNVYAVIKGSATNNDGAVKTGFTTPSISGQTKVLLEALAVADVSAETISYIETHGPGTVLGDSVEMAALTQGFRTQTRQKQFCAVGSVKSNMGHLGAASGVASLIKTALALKYKMIPPTLNYEYPNPQIDFANSPFYVNARPAEWETNLLPRRAGVSAAGLGGSNAHVVLEEAPIAESSTVTKPSHLLVLSARTSSALEAMIDNLHTHLKDNPDVSLVNLAFTLQVGRKAFAHRYMLVCSTLTRAVDQLERRQGTRTVVEPGERPVVFMFPGQGTQYINMGLGLYHGEAVFREQVDRCAELLKPHLQLDIREIMYPSQDRLAEAQQQLDQTFIAQPALFVIEYALAKLWIKWGIQPRAMIGHSLGEYVVACLAGVFSLEDALALVVARGRMIQALPGGAMLSVSLPAEELQTLLGPELSLAAISGAADCLVAGPTDAIERLERQLTEQEVSCQRLAISHAFHSHIVEPVLAQLTALVQQVHLHPPKIPYLSNLTGTWITEQEATDPRYWARHLRQTVLFAQGLEALLEDPNSILLEVGPGRALTTIARRHPRKNTDQLMLTSLRHLYDPGPDHAWLLNACGRLWCAGVPIKWPAMYAGEQRQRISLPTYPFERKRYWTFPRKQSQQDVAPVFQGKKPDIADWFYIPSWKRSASPLFNADLAHIGQEPDQSNSVPCWLVFADGIGFGARLIERLEQAGATVITVIAGEQFSKVDKQKYTLHPQRLDGYRLLLEGIQTDGLLPTQVAHCWTVMAPDWQQANLASYETTQALGFYSLLYLIQAWGEEQPLQLTVLSNNLQEVLGDEVFCPARASALGFCKVVPYEYPYITCRSIDIVLPESERAQKWLIDQLTAELGTSSSSDTMLAYRGTQRWVQTFEPMRIHKEQVAREAIRLKERGVYLISGGLGGIGLVLAEHLAQAVRARLVLTGRSHLPAREDWEHWLNTHTEQDESSAKIRQIQRLEELGAEVLVCAADSTDLEQMQAVVAQTKERFGALNGVIHAAGILGAGSIQLKDPEVAARVLAPKAKGALVLEAVLHDIHVDFIVLWSSLSTILGGLGLADYSASNAVLDSFAAYNTSRNGVPTLAINWSTWQEVGMAVATAASTTQKVEHASRANTMGINDTNSRQQQAKENPQGLREEGIRSKEGVEAFRRILARGVIPQVVVSVQDLANLAEQAQRFVNSRKQETSVSAQASSLHQRPSLEEEYVAPRTETEQQIAYIWQEALGIETVGVCDDFAELGGDSVTGIKILNRLRQEFGVELTMYILFSNPTIEGLAEVITQKQLALLDSAETAELLQNLANMSEEEAQLHLQ